MNTWFGIGRATKDCEINTTVNGINVAKFTIAVDRKFKDADGNKVADFINIVAWRGLADICVKYIKRGQQVAVKGELQIRSYDANDETKRYVTEIIADDIKLLGSKSEEKKTLTTDLQPIESDGLPF